MYVSILNWITPVATALLCVISYTTHAQTEPSIENHYKQEYGFGFGTLNLLGETDPSAFAGYNLRIFYSRDIDHYFSIRPSIQFGQSYNIRSRPLGNELILIDPNIFEAYSNQQPWFAKVKTNLLQFQIEGILELSNLNQSENPWNYYLKAGIGLYSYGTWLDLKDHTENAYGDLLDISGVPNQNDPNTIRGRREIRSIIQDYYDGTYETPGPKEDGKFRLGNETSIYPSVSFGIGLSYNVKDLFSVSIEHELMLSQNDYLDAIPSLSVTVNNNAFDIVQSTQLCIAIPFGKAKHPPKHWVNPVIQNNAKYAHLEDRIESLENKLTDTDQDGVLDFLDREKYSKQNAIVTTKGVEVKQNKRPSNEGRAMSKQFIDSILSHNHKQKDLIFSSLPLIYFDTNKATLKSSEYPKIAKIVHALSINPDISCIRVIGHADFIGLADYNEKLALQRAQTVVHEMNRSAIHELKLKIITESKGETDPLFKKEAPEYFLFNRYVEITSCQSSD